MYFEQSETMNEKCVSAMLGRAIIEYHNQSYEESAKFYIRAIRLNPSLPPQVKIGLANCYVFLEKYHLASHWFTLILQKDPKSILSILGLANIAFRAQDYGAYNKYLQMAHQLDPMHPELILILAEQSLVTGNWSKATLLATHGLASLQKRGKFIQSKQTSGSRVGKNDYFTVKSKLLFTLGFCAHQDNNI